MSDTPHTPLPRLLLLPYRQEESFVFSADDLRVADCECDGQDVPEGYTEQIAAFIARACNSHYELLEALEQIVWKLGHNGGETKETSTPVSITRLDITIKNAVSVIAKAREGL